jgi:hypothetical protein
MRYPLLAGAWRMEPNIGSEGTHVSYIVVYSNHNTPRFSGALIYMDVVMILMRHLLANPIFLISKPP